MFGKIRYQKKWWAYYTSVAGASSFESVCRIPINPDYTLYTFLVEATLEGYANILLNIGWDKQN